MCGEPGCWHCLQHWSHWVMAELTGFYRLDADGYYWVPIDEEDED
jgi:hypothetical protein